MCIKKHIHLSSFLYFFLVMLSREMQGCYDFLLQYIKSWGGVKKGCLAKAFLLVSTEFEHPRLDVAL